MLTENCGNIKASKPPIVRNSSLSSFPLAPIAKLPSFYHLFSCCGVFNCFILQGLCLICCSSGSQSQEVHFSECANFSWWICNLGLCPATSSRCLWSQIWIRRIRPDKNIVLVGSKSTKDGCLRPNVIFANGRKFKYTVNSRYLQRSLCFFQLRIK